LFGVNVGTLSVSNKSIGITWLSCSILPETGSATAIIITGIRSRQHCYIGVTESAGPSDGCGFAAAIDGRS